MDLSFALDISYQGVSAALLNGVNGEQTAALGVFLDPIERGDNATDIFALEPDGVITSKYYTLAPLKLPLLLLFFLIFL